MPANSGSQPAFRQHPTPASLSGEEDENELTLVTLINILLRHRFGILALAVLISLLSVGVALLGPRTYASTGSFLPQGGQSPSTMSGLAAQFGVDFGGSNQGASPAFYADLAQTRQILGTVVAARYRVPDAGRETVGTLVEFFRARGRDWAHRRDAAITKLKQAMTVSFDSRTSVVSVSVKTENPELSRQVVDSLLSAVSTFNLERRQSQASAERRFIEARLVEVRTDLRKADDELQFFLQRNRILGSAELEAQRERLTREVALQQQVYSTLAQAFERAKLEEVRDTPVITVVQSPEAALRPNSRRLATKAVLTLLIGAFLGALFAAMRDRFGRHDGVSPNELRDFAELKRQTLRDLKHPLRAISRWFNHSKSRRSEDEISAADAQSSAL